MTAREKALVAYGGRCAWCGRADSLEFDHIRNDGAAHRATLTMPLERWLCREYRTTGYWPVTIQLLCLACHDRKSGRLPKMPPRQGATALNIALPDDLALQLATLAANPAYGSKSRVVEAGLHALLESNASVSLMDGFHQRLSVVGSTISATLQTLEKAIDALQQDHYELRHLIHTLDLSIKKQGDEMTKHTSALTSAYDRLRKEVTDAVTPKKSSWFS